MHFLCGSLPNVASEIALCKLAYNMKRVLKVMGVAGLIEAMTT